MANRTIDQTKSATDRLRDGFAPGTPDLDEVATAAPLEQRADGNGAPMVPADAAADRLLISEAATLARLAEQDRFDDQANADRLHIGAAKDLLAEAIGQREGEAARQLVDPALIRRLQGELAQWATARGLNGHGHAGGGSDG
jgi:hypothetical protein